MQMIHGSNRRFQAVALVLFSLTALDISFAAERERERTASRADALPNFVELAEKLEPVVVNIAHVGTHAVGVIIQACLSCYVLKFPFASVPQ